MDFNTLNITEKDYKDQPILMNEVDLFFSEVELLLTTNKTDVLGRNDFGFDSKRIIWQLNASESKIRVELHAHIEQNCFSNEVLKQWSVDVRFMQGSQRDIALIDIIAVPFDGSEVSKSFIFN